MDDNDDENFDFNDFPDNVRPLTKSFDETVLERAKNDERFRFALLEEIWDELLSGGCTINSLLRFYTRSSPCSEIRQIEITNEKISLQKFFFIISKIQESEGVSFSISQPNKTTIDAMKDADKRNTLSADSVDDLFNKDETDND